METFYFTVLGLSFIWNEITWVISFNHKTMMSHDIKVHQKEHGKKNLEDMPEKIQNYLKGEVAFNILSFLFVFLGIFTNQWFIFVIFLLTQVVIISVLNKIVIGNLTSFRILHGINTAVSLIFGLFMMVNYLHLGIDTTEVIKSWIIAYNEL